MKVKIYQDSAKEWRWRAVARNGEIIADSAEGYSSQTRAKSGFKGLCEAIVNEEVEYEVFVLS